MHKVLTKHAFILRAIYPYINEMKFFNISNPLPAIGGIYSMYEEIDCPNYPENTRKASQELVQNVDNYKCIIEILDRNWMELEYRVQDYEPQWQKK